jgi:hypothetical protein
MITLTREEAEQVLKLLDTFDTFNDFTDVREPIRAKLSEPEPVAKMQEMLEVQGSDGNWNYDSYMHGMYNGMEYMLSMVESREPVFREAPKKWLSKREWVGLTDEEVMSLLPGAVRLPPGWADTVRAIEAKLKEKNT